MQFPAEIKDQTGLSLYGIPSLYNVPQYNLLPTFHYMIAKTYFYIQLILMNFPIIDPSYNRFKVLFTLTKYRTVHVFSLANYKQYQVINVCQPYSEGVRYMTNYILYLNLSRYSSRISVACQ